MNVTQARIIRRKNRKKKIRDLCRDQVIVGDAANKLRTMRLADIHKIDKKYNTLKAIQWAELLDAFDELYQGSAYLPKSVSDAIEAIHLAFIQNRTNVEIYFNPEAVEDL
jgi:hypothetical protein